MLGCFEDFVCLDLGLSSVVLKTVCLDLVSSVLLKILCVWVLCLPLFLRFCVFGSYVFGCL